MSQSVLPFIIWAYETLFWNPDVVLHECTPTFDVEGLAVVFGAIYVILSFVFCPAELGLPMRRRRRYTLMVHKTRRFIPFAIDQMLFSALFFRQQMVDGHIYWDNTPDEVVQQFVVIEAAAMHLPPTDADGNPWPCRSILHQGYLQRLLGYERSCRLRGRALRFIVNIHQTCKFSRAISKYVPTLLTKTSHIWSMVHRRLLAPIEFLVVMGIPVFREGPAVIGAQRLVLTGKLSPSVSNSWQGTQWHKLLLVSCYLLLWGSPTPTATSA
jgi:hypothetical protein